MDLNTSSTRIGNRYLLLNEIGEGGMGVVYRAKDRLTGREVALKRVHTHLETLNLDDSLQVEDFRLALAREFKLSASLRHPNIVDVLDYGFDNDKQPYFTMELLQNPGTIVDGTQNQPTNKRIEHIIQMLYALSYLHRRGIVHRDLKPANVLITDDVVKVLDFGLSTMHERNVTDDMADTTVGTLAYMAPEVLTGSMGGILADLYAVGMLGYEILSGKHPFNIDDPTMLINQILAELPPIDGLDVPVGLASVILKLVQKDPDERYQSAIETIDALRTTVDLPRVTELSAIRDSFLQAARFIGREQEIQQLNNAIQQAIAGKGSMWLIGGESGVGKSRIIDELRTQAMVNGVIVMRGQAVDIGSRPYEIWLTALRWLCLMDENLSDHDVALLKLLVSDADIDNLVQRDITDISAAIMPPDEAQSQMLQLFARVLGQSERPILMLFEDLHWADSASIQALAQWSTIAKDLPILIAGSYRDDEKPNLDQQLPDANLMKLGRLANDEIADLSAAMLGEAGRTPQVVDLLRRESEGNIFFVVEVVRALAEEVGNLEEIGRMTLPARVFAGGVQAVLQRRLRHLDEDSKELLRYAALMGRELNIDTLTKLMPKMKIQDWIANCISASVLEVNDEVYQFAHDKLRVGLVDITGADERKAIHKAIAQILDREHSRDEAYFNALAHHWGQAGDIAKEERYVTLAGEQSLKIGAYNEAVVQFSRARQLVEQLDVDDAKKKRKYVHLNQRSGEAYLGLGDYDTARTLYDNSLTLCRELGDNIAIAVSLSHIGNVDFATEKFTDAQTRYQQALELYRQENNQAGIARALNRLGDIAYELGEQDRAKKLYQESLQISREIGSDWGMAGASKTQTVHSIGTGTSVDNLVSLLVVARQQDDTTIALKTLMRLSRAYVKINEKARALEILASLLHMDDTSDEMLDEAEQIVFTLQEELDKPDADRAWEVGKGRTLTETLDALIPQ